VDDRSLNDRSSTGRVLIDVLAYLVARLLLVAVLTVVILLGSRMLGIDEFPLVIAMLFAIIIALPLGMWVFAPLRKRATASIAAVDERRRRDREQLQSRLRGEGPKGK
jgi:antibiotic biosynthesis monooxygenase (ABM) superfamily enzyme